MTSSQELVWLLGRLRDARSRRSRLRLLFEAWETVRSLSPADRLAVARELGFDGAERLVEEVARRQGMDAAPFVAALGGVERSAGREVTDVLRGLADPSRRAETVDRLIEGAGRWAADLERPHPQAEPLDGDTPTEGTKEGGDGADAWREDAPEPAVVATPVPPQPAEGEAAGLAALGSAADSGAADGLVPRPTTAAGPSVVPGASRVVDELVAEPRLVARLRLLPRVVGDLADVGHEALVAVLECFPAGWARRRALERLLAAGVPASTADAIALLELLVRPSERLWAITTLAATRRLDDSEREALLAAAPSVALRRRLRSRSGGGRS